MVRKQGGCVRETGSREDKRCWNRTRRSAGDFFFGLDLLYALMDPRRNAH